MSGRGLASSLGEAGARSVFPYLQQSVVTPDGFALCQPARSGNPLHQLDRAQSGHQLFWHRSPRAGNAQSPNAANSSYTDLGTATPRRRTQSSRSVEPAENVPPILFHEFLPLLSLPAIVKSRARSKR